MRWWESLMNSVLSVKMQDGLGRGLFWGEYTVLRNLVRSLRSIVKIFGNVNVAMFLQVG